MTKILKNNSGTVYVKVVALILVVLIIMCGAMEYLRLVIIAQGVRDGVQAAVISVVTENYNETYPSLRQGYSGGYTLDETDNWESLIDNGAVYYKLSALLNLQKQGRIYISYTENYDIEYYVTNLDIDVENVQIKSNASDEFRAEVEIDLSVPVYFGGSKITDMDIPLKLNAKYIPKF